MQMLTVTNSTLTMSSREIATLLKKQHSNVRKSAERLAKGGTIALQETPYINEQNGQTYYEYNLNKRDSLILVAQNCPEFTAAIVDRWQELEAKAGALSLPDFSNPIEAARAWADAKEAEQKAIATKAQINDKRTATIMGRLGNATKKIKSLEDKLQDVGSYLSVIAAKLPQRVDTQMKSNVQSWRLLKQISSDMQLPPKKVQDQRYGEVFAYHIDVIDRFKDLYI
jgi:phage regulator Rha-like protein